MYKDDQQRLPHSNLTFLNGAAPIAAGWITWEGKPNSKSAYPFIVRASAQEQHSQALHRYTHSLYVEITAPPHDGSDAPPSEQQTISTAAWISQALQDYPASLPILMSIDVPPFSTNLSFLVAAEVHEQHTAHWKSEYNGLVKMTVQAGAGRLHRQGYPDSAIIHAPHSTEELPTNGRCSVTAIDGSCDYQLDGDWHRGV